MRQLFFLLSIFSALLALNGCSPKASNKPLAREGVLDLRNYDFQREGNIALDGQWKFYWEQLLVNKDFNANNSLKEDTYISLPGYWNGTKVGKQSLHGFGYATYRLKVLLPKDYRKLLCLKFLTISSAYRFYINDSLQAYNGLVGGSANNYKPDYQPQINGFVPDTSVLDLTMQIANYSHKLGGPWVSIKLGTEEKIAFERGFLEGMELFLIGSILIMALYHFGLYILRRKETAPLYFGLFSTAIVIRIAVTGEYSIHLFLHLPWAWLLFWEYLSIQIAILSFSLFIYRLFPREFSKIILKIILAIVATFSFFILFFPSTIYSYTPPFFQLFMLLAGLYFIFVLIKAFIHKREGARAFMVGFLILFSTVINDILFQSFLIQTMNLISLGLFLFIFCQAFLLSHRFSKAFVRSEELTTELDFLNKNLEEKIIVRTSEIKKQKEQIESSHRSITDSIVYASRIQNAILPTEDQISEIFPENFIIYRPCSIISGDFYFFRKMENKLIVAAADCTGHGVPGAFMSMLGLTLLNEIVGREKILQPNFILNKLRERVKRSLHQYEDKKIRKDGMDIALCIIDLTSFETQFSGAYNPLWIMRNGELIEILADRMPISIHPKEREFTNHTLQLEKGDTLYLFSDGYESQAGGEKLERLKPKRMQEIFKSIQNLSLQEQKAKIEEAFDAWRGIYKQVDDVLVLGIKISN
jgi:serine phosphatase RsbU (regulator of sigma subunit)